MASPVLTDTVDQPGPAGPPPVEGRRRRRVGRVLLLVLAAVVVLVAVAVVWFILGRERASEKSEDQAVADFRAGGGSTSSQAEGLPAAGVYAATASGTESIGLPGFDESLGPDAPVTVTHDEDGCFTYRADFNSHHWRSWTYCPTATATFALTRLDSWTARKAPGFEVESLTTYTCSSPLDVLWPDATAGQVRTSACTGTTDIDDSVTEDAGEAEVLGTGTLGVGDASVDVVRLRTSDVFSRDQTGFERAEWWLDASTGLPLKVDLEAEVSGPSGDYAEDWTLELSTLEPAT